MPFNALLNLFRKQPPPSPPQEILRAPTWYENALLTATSPNIPQENALVTAMDRLTAASAVPAKNYITTGQASPQDVIQGLTGQKRGEWTDVIASRYPNLNPFLQKAYGFGMNVLTDPTNLMPGAMMAGEIKNVYHGSPHLFDKFSHAKSGNHIDLYHGTSDEFPSFDLTKTGTKTASTSSKKGIWFTDNPRSAEVYATITSNEVIPPKYIKYTEPWTVYKENTPKDLLDKWSSYMEAITKDTDAIRKELWGAVEQKDGNWVVHKDKAASLISKYDEYISDLIKNGTPIHEIPKELGLRVNTFDESQNYDAIVQEIATKVANWRNSGLIKKGSRSNVRKHSVNTEGFKVVDVKNIELEKAFKKINTAIDNAKKQGVPGLKILNIEDGGPRSTHYVVFDPKAISLEHEIYDPLKLKSKYPNQSRPPEKGGKTALSDIGEAPGQQTGRKIPPIITTEQKKRQAKAKAVKEQQLKIESAEDAKKAVHSMIRERRYRLNLATYESNLFINEIERATSREQREVIPFIIENTDVPKGLNRPDLEKIHAAEKANLAPIARQVKDHFDKGWQRMKESTPDMSAEQIEDYVTHIWDVPKSKKREVTSWFTTQNRFLKKRFIETINEGVEKFGLQPKTLDISEIIRIHDSVMNRVIENNRFVEDLKKLRKDGVPLIERADKAPQDWAYFDHPALRRGLIIPGEAKMGEKVSPELADILAEMGVAIGRRISPVTFGKPTWKAGEYRPGDTPEVRFQRFMSNRTIAHEIGHHLDAALGLGDKFLNKYKTELYEVNRKRIESFAGTDKEAYAKSTEEQIAEFFAILFTNPDLASRVAPTATADALTRLKGDGVLTKLVDFDFEKNAKNLIEERLDTMVKLPVKVHPDLEAPLKVIFESRMTHPAIQAFETMNGILKKTELSLSLFHHVALGETGIGTMGLPKTLGIYFNPVKIYKAMWRGEYDIYKKEPIARDAIEHGLQVGATSDIPVNMIQTKLNDMARKTRNVLVINKAMALLRTFNEQWDKALWNYLHDTLKLQGYESLCAKMDPTKDIKAQKEEIAQFVNDTFGGQNWDVLMVSPKSLQLMSWFLLSPDWTLSTLRQALAPTGIGTIHKEAGSALRKKMGAHFWVKAGLYFGLGINMLNHMNRKRDEKEHPEYYEGEDRGFFDRTMAGNAIGHKTHLFAGRYDDGTERYVRWGKQFRELPEMFFDDTGFSPISATIKKIGGKMAPALQLASSILTGSSLSGFRNDDINGKEGWDKVYGIAKTVMKSPFPFSSRTMFDENKEFHFTDVAMPSSKGMTRYRSIELFKVAIEKDDERLLKEVYQDTLRNNLPAYTLFNASLAQLKAESTNEYNEGLKSIADVQERAKDIKSPIEAARLARVMRRMIKENADRMAGIRLLDAAILNLKKYQVLSEAEAGSKK